MNHQDEQRFDKLVWQASLDRVMTFNNGCVLSPGQSQGVIASEDKETQMSTHALEIKVRFRL